ncbi:MAG: DNA/RNA helicase domain-containing protein [Acidimicrobiales bacterium]
MTNSPKWGLCRVRACTEYLIHPDLEEEQAYIDHAYECLEASKVAAARLTTMVESGTGGTNQARFERDVIAQSVAKRLSQLELGRSSLIFGRIDHDIDHGDDAFYIGRLGVWNKEQDPVVVDWRAPAAEPFYRATGPEPLGLVRRRHFATRARELVGVEDELFGDLARFVDDGSEQPKIKGQGALIAALEQSRTGRLGDIVATIQGEQDEIIRSTMRGVLVVQGGPGTGKTVVALHRAAYLLYTNRFPLEGQGVLVVGPNRLFLAYIEQVLPSLGEAGIQLAVVGDLIPHARVNAHDTEVVSRLKGDLVMVDVIRNAVRTRERALREDFSIGYGLDRLRFSREQSAEIVRQARRRYRTHNAARKFVNAEFFNALAADSREGHDVAIVRDRLRYDMSVREALEWMWPVLTPAHLLHDLFGSTALLRAAGRGTEAAESVDLLFRERSDHASGVVFTMDDAPLLDEALALLGPRRGKGSVDEVRTYGHIVIDEAQDLSPMELRLLKRRSLNGSMTIVGDIAQATGAWAHDDWESVLAHLPQKQEPRRKELTIGYRIPAPTMSAATKILPYAAPQLDPPNAIREDGDEPIYLEASGDLWAGLERVIRDEVAAERGNVAVIVPVSLREFVEQRLVAAEIAFGRATRSGLDHRLTVVPVTLVKGLEVDSAIVVEPASIIAEERQGYRSLYVALTRATKRVTVVFDQPLPDALL